MSRGAGGPPSFARAFAVPWVIAACTTITLVLALLVGSRPWQWASWLALGAPIALTVHCVARGRSK